MHGIALQLDGDRPQLQPAGDGGIGICRDFQRLCAFGGAADLVEEFFAAGAQGGGVRQVAFALDEGARAFDRMAGEE